MRTYFQALILTVLAGPLCASAAPSLKGIYKASNLGLLDVGVSGGRVVGKFRTSGQCNYSVDEEVLTGKFEGNVFIGNVLVCQTGEGCSGASKLYPFLAIYSGKALVGEVALPEGCTSQGLSDGRRFVLEEATAEEKQQALEPAKPVSDKIPRNANKREREAIAEREFRAASDHFNKGRYKLAADGFEVAVAANEAWGLPVMMLGVCKVKLQKWKEGKALIDKGLKMSGKTVSPELRALANYSLAVVADANGQRGDAFALMKSAVGLTSEPGAMVTELKKDPDLSGFRSDAQYKQFLADLEKIVAKAPKKTRGG
jgi:hypothetical protein